MPAEDATASASPTRRTDPSASTRFSEGCDTQGSTCREHNGVHLAPEVHQVRAQVLANAAQVHLCTKSLCRTAFCGPLLHLPGMVGRMLRVPQHRCHSQDRAADC